MSDTKFQRHIEDFVCEQCGFDVLGNGYTNHCPQCLWSKHVDINPGDRASLCCGRMRPIAVERKQDDYILVHQCEKCGYEKRNKVQQEDDFDEVVRIATPKR